MAGQIVMEGFVRVRLQPYLRRLITRLIALLPAVVVIWISGEKGTYQLLILSQVILSLQLPFAIVPLVHFTSDKMKMGSFASVLWVKVLAWSASVLIIALNGKLVFDKVTEWIEGGAPLLMTIATIGFVAMISLFLGYIILRPLIGIQRSWKEVKASGAPAIIEGIKTRTTKHIAAALGRDGGDAVIIGQALSMAKAEGALLTLIHVVDSAPAQIYSSDVYDEHTRDDEQYLLEIAEKVRASGVAVEIALPHGDPSKELINFAKKP